MSRSFFAVPPCVSNSLREAEQQVTDAVQSGNVPEIFDKPCNKCGAHYPSGQWKYWWGNLWQCQNCRAFTESPAPETFESKYGEDLDMKTSTLVIDKCKRCATAPGDYEDGLCYHCYWGQLLCEDDDCGDKLNRLCEVNGTCDCGQPGI